MEGSTPFPDEVVNPPSSLPAVVPIDVTEDQSSVKNAPTTNYASDDITELIASSVTVDNEGPAPENTAPPPPTTEPVGIWEKPVICHQRANPAIHDLVAQWKNASNFVLYSERSLFQNTRSDEIALFFILQNRNVSFQNNINKSYRQFLTFFQNHSSRTNSPNRFP